MAQIVEQTRQAGQTNQAGKTNQAKELNEMIGDLNQDPQLDVQPDVTKNSFAEMTSSRKPSRKPHMQTSLSP